MQAREDNNAAQQELFSWLIKTIQPPAEERGVLQPPKHTGKNMRENKAFPAMHTCAHFTNSMTTYAYNMYASQKMAQDLISVCTLKVLYVHFLKNCNRSYILSKVFGLVPQGIESHWCQQKRILEEKVTNLLLFYSLLRFFIGILSPRKLKEPTNVIYSDCMGETSYNTVFPKINK